MQWTSIQALSSPKPRSSCAIYGGDGRIWIFGGMPIRDPQQDLYMYDIGINSIKQFDNKFTRKHEMVICSY